MITGQRAAYQGPDRSYAAPKQKVEACKLVEELGRARLST